jgi:sulfur carrier protein
MKIKVNGAETDAPAGASLASVVARVSPRNEGVAVALNGEVVPRAAWAATTVREADSVEVLTAVQGG